MKNLEDRTKYGRERTAAGPLGMDTIQVLFGRIRKHSDVSNGGWQRI